MRLTIDIDDEEIRSLLVPIIHNQTRLPTATGSPKLLTIGEVATELNISRSKAYQVVNGGTLPSLAIGRTKRVSSAALAEYIERPVSAPPEVKRQRTGGPQQLTRDKRSSALVVNHPRTKRPAPTAIDLSPRPSGSGSSRPRMTQQECDVYCEKLSQRGWPTDVLAQMRADSREGVERVYMLTLRDTARYLGVSADSVDKLTKSGELRLVTIAPPFSDEKPSKRIPAIDVLALTKER